MACALGAVAAAIVVVLRAPHHLGEDLIPRPDALDYAIVAHRIADGERPGLPLAGRLYPSRYPLGFPLLLAPAVRIGTPPADLWHVTALVAIAGVAFTYLAALRLTAPVEALWGAALLALAPAYVRLATMTMSDAPAAAFAAVWLLLLTLPFTTALGVVSGFACSIRLMCAPLLLAGAAVAIMRGRRASARFVVGVAVGLAPVIVAAVVGWSGPLAGYTFWGPDTYGTMGTTFRFAALRANFSEYAEALMGVGRHSPFYSFPVPALAALGMWAAWNGHRSSRRVLPIAAAAVGMHCGVALSYFFHDVRLLLPVLPLVIVAGTCGLHRVAARRPAFAIVLGVVVLAVQANAAARSMRRDGGSASVASTLTAVGESLPRGGLVVSDVGPGLAWLYWTRGTARDFMPLLVPSASLSNGLYTDRMLFRLASNAAHGRGTPPPAFVDDEDRPTDAARDAVERSVAAEQDITIVACTKRGRATMPTLEAELPFSPPTRVAGCYVMTMDAPVRKG